MPTLPASASQGAELMSAAGAALAASGLPIAEARALLAHVLHVPRERLIAHPETSVPAPALAVYQSLVVRRRGGEPLAYLRGGSSGLQGRVLVPLGEFLLDGRYQQIAFFDAISSITSQQALCP